MAKARANIRDVAKECGVSLTTVSLVLNKNDARISEATRQKVLDAMERLSYTPSRLARGLPNRRAKTLAVLVPALQHAFADVYFGEIISGIYEAAADAGYRILLEVARREYIRRKEYMTLLEDCSVDGILFIGATEEHRWLSEFHETDLPLLIVNNHFRQWDLDYVVCDYPHAGQLAAEYLVKLGHRRIGHICGPSDMVLTSRELTDSFVDALAKLGVHLRGDMIVEGQYLVEMGKLACDELLARDPKISAIFASNDKMALGAYQSLRQHGRHPGKDIAVVGCDDIPTAALADPPLTTIRMNFFEVGRESCRHLLNAIDVRSRVTTNHSNGLTNGGSGDAAATGHVGVSERIPVSLVLRESSCPPA